MMKIKLEIIHSVKLKKIFVMKHIYFFLSLFLSTLAYGQATDLYFSMYGEGSSNNKFLEIYNGTGSDMDLSIYKVELYTNGDTTVTHSLSLSGTLPAGDVYVIAHASADQTILNAADTTHTVCYFNGDDAIVLKKNDNPLDVIGVVGERPSSGGWDVAGVAHATKDHTLVRKPTVCSPTTDWSASAGTDENSSQWNVLARDGGWDQLGSHNGCSNAPTLLITSPSNNQVFSPETTAVDVEFQVTNFTVAQSGGDGYIVYTVDGGTPQDKYNTDPIHLTGLTQGTHTVELELVDNNGHSLNPAVTDEVSFIIASYTQVANLTDLRAGTLGDYYEITGEVILTAGEKFSSYLKAFVQDANAGIMIYDRHDVIDPTQYSIYDGITGLKGKLTEYRGTLELIPTVDPGPSSSGNTVTPQTVTLSDYKNNREDYESELIKIVSVQIDPDNDTQFQLNHNYDLYDANDTIVLRVIFTALEGKTIPTDALDVTGIGGEYRGNSQIYPRDENDLEQAQSIIKNEIPGLRVYPNPVTNGVVFIQTPDNEAKKVEIIAISGKTVYSATLDANGKIRISLEPGVYMIKVIERNKTGMAKLLIR